MIPVVTTAGQVAEHVAVVDAERLSRALAAADERPIDYPYGSGEAEVVALLAGLKPLVRQILPPSLCERARARFSARGFSVEEASVPPPVPADAQRVLYIAKDPAIAREAARRESALDHARLGTLLGYPRCCVDVFAALPAKVATPAALEVALARTRTAPRPRLNVLDLGVFHFISWIPCAFDCARSLAYAAALAEHVAHRSPNASPGGCPRGCRHQVFVERIDAALGAHRLLVLEDVQVSMRGRFAAGSLEVREAWATARDRHPAARLDPAAREAAARLAAAIEAEASVRVEEHTLFVGGRPILRSADMLLVPFGS